MLVLPIPQNNNEGVIPYRPSLSKLVRQYRSRIQRPQKLKLWVTKVQPSERSAFQSVLRVLQEDAGAQTGVDVNAAGAIIDELFQLQIKIADKEAWRQSGPQSFKVEAVRLKQQVEDCKQRFAEAMIPGERTDAQNTMLSFGLVTLMEQKYPNHPHGMKPSFQPPETSEWKHLFKDMGRTFATKAFKDLYLKEFRQWVSGIKEMKWFADVCVGLGKSLTTLLAPLTGGTSLAVLKTATKVFETVDTIKDKGYDLTMFGLQAFVGFLMAVVGIISPYVVAQANATRISVQILAKFCTSELVDSAVVSPLHLLLIQKTLHVAFEMIRAFGLPEISEAEDVEQVKQRLRRISEKKSPDTQNYYTKKTTRAFKWMCGLLKPKNKLAAVMWPIYSEIWTLGAWVYETNRQKASAAAKTAAETAPDIVIVAAGDRMQFMEDRLVVQLKEILGFLKARRNRQNPLLTTQARNLVRDLMRRDVVDSIATTSIGIQDELISTYCLTWNSKISGLCQLFVGGGDTIMQRLVSDEFGLLADFTVVTNYVDFSFWGNVFIDAGNDYIARPFYNSLPAPSQNFGTGAIINLVGNNVKSKVLTGPQVGTIRTLWSVLQDQKIGDAIFQPGVLRGLIRDIVRPAEEWRALAEAAGKNGFEEVQAQLAEKADALEGIAQRIESHKVTDADERIILTQPELRDKYVESFSTSRLLKNFQERLLATNKAAELPSRVQVQDFVEDPQYETSRAIRAQIEYLEQVEEDQMLVKKYVETSNDFTSPNAKFTLEDVAQNEDAVRSFNDIHSNDAELMRSLASVQNTLAQQGQLSQNMLVDREPFDVRSRNIALEDKLQTKFTGSILSPTDETSLFEDTPGLLVDYAKSLATSRVAKRMWQRFLDWHGDSKYTNGIVNYGIADVYSKEGVKAVIEQKELQEKASDAVAKWLQEGNELTANSDFIVDDVYESESATKLWLKGVNGFPPLPTEEQEFLDGFTNYWWSKQSFLRQLLPFQSLPDWGNSLVTKAIDSGVYVPSFTSVPTPALGFSGLPVLALQEKKDED